jgi:hypothetical protein
VCIFEEARQVPLPQPLFVDSLEALPALTRDIVSRTHSAIDPVYIAKLRNVTLTGDRDLVTQDGLYLADLWNQAGLHTKAPGPVRADGRVIEVAGLSLLLFHNASSGDNHSHWLLQTLPQLGHCERAGIKPDRLVVQPNIRPYQREVLAAFGYGADRLIERDPCHAMRFGALCVGYVDGGLVPCAAIYDRQIEMFDADRRGPERIYISRQDARGIRKCLNEPELIERLRPLGFTIVNPSALSAAEEVTVFRDARLIVGPLGAGLYNALFTKSGAVVIALSDPRYVMEWLAQTAALRGHAYGWIFGLAFESYDPVYTGTHGNWIIDVQRAVRRLNSIDLKRRTIERVD